MGSRGRQVVVSGVNHDFDPEVPAFAPLTELRERKRGAGVTPRGGGFGTRGEPAAPGVTNAPPPALLNPRWPAARQARAISRKATSHAPQNGLSHHRPREGEVRRRGRRRRG